MELMIWTCETCGRAVDTASDRAVQALSGDELLARVERTMAEHEQTDRCPPGLTVQVVEVVEL